MKLTLNTLQGLLALAGMALYCWASFWFPGSNERPFLAPWPWVNLVLAILYTFGFAVCARERGDRQRLNLWVGFAGSLFGILLAAGVWAKGYDIYMAWFFWVYLSASATVLKHPNYALAMASVNFAAMSAAHFFADATKMPYPWWFFSLIGLGFILVVYNVLVRNFQNFKELQNSRKLLIVKNEEATDALKKLETHELELTAYAHRLEESNHNLQEFAYVISHDLREPLRTVTAYTQLLKRHLKPEQLTNETSDFMHFIIDAAKRMDAQINGILEYSRVGRTDLKIEKLDLEELVEDVKHNLSAQIFENQAVIEIERPFVEVKADKIQMTLLLQNLVSNALKYRKTDVTPHIKIGAVEENNQVKIAVQDNGIGIEPQYLDMIFGVFRRLHTRKDIEGSGIGLSICRRIAQRHGGRIWAESTFGEGATFFVVLPEG